ncbi:hypothetical protein SAMN02799624_01693 [Paenibacillus sp. UNC496MF]|uniref:collagen-binding domain-containing protein n=1 Tax=Paenibacillus sp. UNC496MF TaxID=1502753 RepID=UPI0008F4077F|nr:collagen-binding domain-containing protein [Paenibacillus sp. UNC496MF]SFI62436.1 hypothetical protein SAMN02799624_01693 [Paenibacillus sp. UNC496MF]
MACANLGVVNDFNVFVLGNHTQSFVDAGKRVAVGGKATLADGSPLRRGGQDRPLA